MRKILLLSTVVLLLAGLLAGCGSSSLPGGSGFGGDILRDKAAMKKAMEQMQEKGGTPLKIFQNVNIGTDFINFNRQDQKKPENVDNYTWHANGGWKGPAPVKLKGDGNLEDNLYDFNDVNWLAIPDFVANAEKKAKEEGIDNPKITGILVMFNVTRQTHSFSATIKGERKDASASGDAQTGDITYFKIR